jgi:hypothetical protein
MFLKKLLITLLVNARDFKIEADKIDKNYSLYKGER